MITCLTNKWDYSGDAKDASVVVTLEPWGNARNPSGLTWSYIDLWSALTTWGNDAANVPEARNRCLSLFGRVWWGYSIARTTGCDGDFNIRRRLQQQLLTDSSGAVRRGFPRPDRGKPVT